MQNWVLHHPQIVPYSCDGVSAVCMEEMSISMTLSHKFDFYYSTANWMIIFYYIVAICSAAVQQYKFVFITAQFIMVHLGSDTPIFWVLCV